MNLKKRIEELKLFAKTDQRVLAGAGFVFLAFLLFLGTNNSLRLATRFASETQQQAARPGTGSTVATSEPSSAISSERRKVRVLAPGDGVKLRLLTGVTAPVDGTPYPVMFKLVGDVLGAEGATLNLGEARLIAAAQGSERDSRVLFRLTDLSIRRQDGRRSVVKVDGWVVGEDGIRGMHGKLFDKLSGLVAASGSPRHFEKLVPFVEVLSGRHAVAIFSKPVEVELCGADYCES